MERALSDKTTDERLLDLFSELDGREDFPVAEIRQKAAFLSTPRCGSSMFCDVLRNTGLAGNPREWINMRYIGAYSRYFGVTRVDLTGYLEFIFRKTTTRNGVFTINFHIGQYRELLGRNFDIYGIGIDRSYLLYRDAKLEQAYSLARATLTDQWSADTRPSMEAPERIGHGEILQALAQIVTAEEYCRASLAERIDRAFRYEDFSDLEHTGAFAQVLADLGVEAPDLRPETSLKRQREREAPPELASLRVFLCGETAGGA